MTPSVSILVPTYEPRSEHLRAALESVLAQTEQDFNVFIHDDASTRDVRTIVQPFLADARFRFERSGTRHGIGGNWNACLQQIDAPCVQFLFQDDLWTPGYLARSRMLLERHPDCSFVATIHDYLFEGEGMDRAFYDEVTRLRRDSFTDSQYEGRLFLQFWLTEDLRPNLIGEPSFVMLKDTIVNAVGLFAEDLPQGLDLDYWVRALPHCNFWYNLQSGGSFRVHPGGASMRNDMTGNGLIDRLMIFERLLRGLPKGELRDEALAARKRALEGMMRRFFARRGTGKGASSQDRQKMTQFAMRHPLLMTGATTRALLS